MYPSLTALMLVLAVAVPVAAPAPVPAPDPAPLHAVGLYGRLDEASGRPVEASAGEFGELPTWELQQALRTDGADLVVETDADGALTVRLDGRFQSAVFGRVDADGRTVVDHDPALLAFVRP